MAEPSLLRAEILLPEAASFARLDGALTTPFQATGWLQHFLEAHRETGRLRLLRLLTPGGAEILLPLLVHRARGATLAVKIGGAHASYFTPGLVGEVPALNAAELVPALRQAARAGAIDALLFEDMLPAWRGRKNPLMTLDARMAPNDAAFLTLGDDAEALLGFLLDKDARKKLRAKSARLAEMGGLAAHWVEEPAAIETALALFFYWKTQQFSARGLADAFGDEAVRRFIVRAAHDPAGGLKLFALSLAGRPVALIGGAMHDGHFAGMFTAYDPRPDIAKHSPGEVMLQALLPALVEAGCRGFDLGAGDARYKTRFCPEKQTLFDAALGVTFRGRFHAQLWRIARRIKGRIKRNPRLMALVEAWRRRRRKRAPGPA
ncbi:GNAT family N-acetyltransferase [Rhabdaerophilum sp. SD176]|uniref:GNAT family N-acetyltransferase n=1 Tax=Rhabdaerophilum sp. SD176 TaxID=2983548 RepID=UPI0024DFDA44|nr:GNAT family N-acetyltransferase [Rhabdaerophilum sp. SD176]